MVTAGTRETHGAAFASLLSPPNAITQYSRSRSRRMCTCINIQYVQDIGATNNNVGSYTAIHTLLLFVWLFVKRTVLSSRAKGNHEREAPHHTRPPRAFP